MLLKRFEVSDEASFEEAAAYCIRRAAAESEEALRQKEEAVRAIVDDVRARGDAAVSEYTARFDGVELSPEQFELSAAEVSKAAAEVDRSLVAALERAHDNIRRFHEKNLRQSWEEVSEDGVLLGQRVTPIESAGVYVPGGTAFYPSSVLMNIVPAKAAGVQEIIMISPPSYQGGLHPLVAAAAKVAGADRVFRIGGAQAVAGLAFGTERMPAVSKITGPGNIYVTIAKRMVSTYCDIDKEAGPSEVAVIADGAADPHLVAIELLCQAEHDEEAVVSLVCTDAQLVERVQEAIGELLPQLGRREIIERALEASGAAFVVPSLDEAVRLVNVIAPEHLSLQVEVPMKTFDKIRNAGAVMIGGATPVAVCDYYAGPNHILPTGRRARYASPLTVEDFRKVTNYVSYSRERMRRDADDIIRLANAEDFGAHAKSVELRK